MSASRHDGEVDEVDGEVRSSKPPAVEPRASDRTANGVDDERLRIRDAARPPPRQLVGGSVGDDGRGRRGAT